MFTGCNFLNISNGKNIEDEYIDEILISETTSRYCCFRMGQIFYYQYLAANHNKVDHEILIKNLFNKYKDGVKNATERAVSFNSDSFNHVIIDIIDMYEEILNLEINKNPVF